MSGLAAIIHTDGRPADPGHIRRMTAAMDHRGPDGISHWCEGSAALGLCLMASTAGMEGATARRHGARIIALAGYLADTHRLALDLSQSADAPATDPDMLCRALGTWGADGAGRLRGAFAAAAWDPETRTLVALRDHMGQRPLHYHWDGATLSLASDIAALLALPWIHPKPNHDFAAELIAVSTFSRTDTLWAGIQRLPPAHHLTLIEDRLTIRPYWTPLDAPDIRYRSQADYARHYLDLLTDVTHRHAQTTSPLGCEVSGGLDSSAIFALAHKLQKTGRLPAPSLHGFTLDFGDHPDANDLPYARSLARHLGVEIAQMPPFQPDLDWYARQARRFGDVPGYPNGPMNLGILQGARDLGCRAVLNGTGGDEWLSGSGAVYTDAVANVSLRLIMQCLTYEFAESGLQTAARSFLRHGLFQHLPPAARRAIRRLLGRGHLQGPDWITTNRNAHIADGRTKWQAQLSACPSAAKASLEVERLDGFHPLSIEMIERLAALTGTEQRAPMLDPDFIEFAYAIPAHLHWNGGPIKALHRTAMGDLLPADVRERRDKAEFSVVFRRALAELPTPQWAAIGDRLHPVLDAGARSKLGRDMPIDHLTSSQCWQRWSMIAIDLVFQETGGTVPSS